VKYLPPFDLIRRSVEISTVRGELRVAMSYETFIDIIKMMIAGIEVNEQWYAETYQDIGEAISAGRIASAKHHFMRTVISKAVCHSRLRSMRFTTSRNIPTWRRVSGAAFPRRFSSISRRMATARAGCRSRCRRTRPRWNSVEAIDTTLNWPGRIAADLSRTPPGTSR
jgi:hypothetical protein